MHRGASIFCAVVASAGCVPDSFTFGSAESAEPYCGDSKVDAAEDCDPGDQPDPSLEDDIGGTATQGIQTGRGCTSDCRFVLQWHEDVGPKNGEAVALALAGDKVTVAGNMVIRHWPPRLFVASRNASTGADLDQYDEDEHWVVHDLTYVGTELHVLATVAPWGLPGDPFPDPFPPLTVVTSIEDSSKVVDTGFDFDRDTFELYGRTGCLGRTPGKNYALGTASGAASLLDVVDAAGLGLVPSSNLPALAGAGPGALNDRGYASEWMLAWGDRIVDAGSQSLVELSLPQGSVARSMCSTLPFSIVVGDFVDQFGRHAGIWVFDGPLLKFAQYLEPPSRAAAVACSQDASGFVVVGERTPPSGNLSLAFAKRFSTQPFGEAWDRSHAGPGFLDAGATAVELDVDGNVYVAGWHQSFRQGKSPQKRAWVRRYAP